MTMLMNEEKERSEKYGELRYDTPGEEAGVAQIRWTVER